MGYIDSHSHYNDEQFDSDREAVIQMNKDDEISKVICAGYDIESSKQSVQISSKYDFIYSTVGISPNDVPKDEKEISKMIEEIEKIIKEDDKRKVIAIGEIGLDYYWNTENKQIQKEMFRRQIELANKYDLPIQIHTREATIDTINILKECSVKRKGMFHCCPLNQELIKEALKLGFYISFAGPITFKNSKNAEEIVKMVPIDKIFTETDSPYLAPEPNRGKRNTPSNIRYVTRKIAEFKQMDIKDIQEQINKNFIELYGKK